MRTDAERWRFLADNSLVLNRSKAGVSVMHYTTAENSGLAPRFTSVATGDTPEDAIDAAIARWERKHRREWKIG